MFNKKYIRGQYDPLTTYTPVNGSNISHPYALGNAFLLDVSAMSGGACSAVVSNWPTGARFGQVVMAVKTGATPPLLTCHGTTLYLSPGSIAYFQLASIDGGVTVAVNAMVVGGDGAILSWLGNGSINPVTGVGPGVFARNTPALYQDSIGVWRNVAENVPRYHSTGALLIGPQKTQDCLVYSLVGEDNNGTLINSGNMVPGRVYVIASRSTVNFMADGAASNDVGVRFECTGTSVTLDVNNAVYRQGGTNFYTGAHLLYVASGLALRKNSGVWTNPTTQFAAYNGSDGDSVVLVANPSLLSASGFGAIAPSGKVFRVTTGNTSMFLTFTGQTGDTNSHAVEIWAAGGTGSIGFSSGGTPTTITSTPTLTRFSHVSVPTSSTRTPKLTIDANQTMYFMLPQMFESAGYNLLSSPVISMGAQTTQLKDDARLPLVGNFSQASGAMVVTIRPRSVNHALTASEGIVTTSAAGAGLLSFGTTSGVIQSTDGTNTSSVTTTWAADEVFKAAVTWGNGKMQVAAKGVAGAEATYTGTYPVDSNNQLFAGFGITAPIWIGPVKIYPDKKTQAWLEAQT